MGGRARGHMRVVRRRGAAENFEVAPSTLAWIPPPSGQGRRTPDPTIARQIAEIDSRLVVEWDPEGIWWTPASRRPPGVMELGAWRIALRGDSGALRGMRMWHPDCADGRLVDYLRATWGAYLFALRSQSSSADLRRKRIEGLRRDKERFDAELFDAYWNPIDHGEMFHAVKVAHNDPKWRSGWQVPAALDARGV